MDSLFSVAAFGMVVVMLVIIVAVQQVQQNSQYREIQDRLREIRHAEMMEQQALSLRTERSSIMDPLNVLEASLQTRSVSALSADELNLVDNARKRMKAVNETLIGNRQWMGAPFDLEWHEILERLPIIRKAYLAANFSDAPPPSDSGDATSSPNLTSFSGPSEPMSPTT